MKTMTKFERAVSYFLVAVIFLCVGYGLRYYHELNSPAHWQIPTQIKHEMRKSKPIVFYVQDLEFTKRRDGSAVMRIKEGGE